MMQDDASYVQDRNAMVARQIARRGITDDRVLEAMRSVPRHAFVLPQDRAQAYSDRPLPIGAGQTISQPYIVARFIEAAELKPGDRVLEVGGGCGYAAAVMGQIADRVWTIERYGTLARQAQQRLAHLGYDNVTMLHGDGTRGLPDQAPFDAIIVSAGGELPEALKDQLAIGGCIVIPLPEDDWQVLTVLRRTGEDDWETQRGEAVRFVPLVPSLADAPPPEAPADLSAVMARCAEPFETMNDLAAMIDRFADRRVIALGESSHGTHEFYAARTAITERLVRDHGFTIVAVEADWPDAAHYDAAIRTGSKAQTAEQPFTRFPRWMWRNAEIWDLLHRLRAINRDRPPEAQAGFYGLDVYSLCASIDAVIAYLKDEDPRAAEEARALYGCLKPYCGDPGAYLRREVSRGYTRCEEGVARVLTDLLQGRMDGMALFDAEQNARIVVEGERYYRSMYYASESSWNLRDRHMADTLDRLLARGGEGARAVVWAHNSHIGDARATEMGKRRGELNIGQLLRERHGDQVALIGFSTHSGEVAAADDWDEPMQIKRVRPGLPDSHEDHAHRTAIPRFLLDLAQAAEYRDMLSTPHLQRAIGVIYRPETERLSHYFTADLRAQFDAWIWFDRTRAVDASHSEPRGTAADLFPSGL